MKRWTLVPSLFLLLHLLPVHAQNAAQTFTLDGKLYSDTAATSPLTDLVQLRIQVLDPTQTCILYEESQPADTTSTDGAFTVKVGSPTSGPSATKRGSNDSGHSMTAVYSNTLSSVSGKLLSNGAGCTYNPASGDQRFVRVVVTLSGGSQQVLSPNMELDSVPMALISERAETLQGLEPASFLLVNNNAPSTLTQANLENIFSTTNYTRLQTMLSVAPSNYLQVGGNGSIAVPSVVGNPGSGLSAGQMWYDSVASQLKYYDGATVRSVAVGTTSASVTGISGTAPITIGGTAQAPIIGVSIGTTSASGVVTLAADGGTTAGTVVQATDARLSDSRAPSGTAGGDLVGTYPNPAVGGILGTMISITGLTNGNYLKYNGANWINENLTSSEIVAALGFTPLNPAQMPASCAANQTLTFSSPTGTWACSNISITPAVFGSQLQATFMAAPAGGAGNPTFRTIAASDLPNITLAAGGTGLSAGGGANQMLGMNNAGNALEYKSISAGSGVSVVHGANNITISATGGTGTVTGVSVATANGLAGSSSGGATPALTLSTTVNGIVKGDGTSFSAAAAGDFPVLNQNTTGTAANVTGVVAVANGGTGGTTGSITGTGALNFAAGGTNENITITPSGTGQTIVTGVMRVSQICDSAGLNCKTVSGGWGAGGSVTNVSAGNGLIGGNITTTGTLSVDVGTTANKILQLDANAQIPAVDGYLLTNLNIQAGNIPTLNQNTTGTAANVTGIVAIANGGTGASTQQSAINALAGATTSGSFLRGNGTNVVLSAIQASDIPTLNQNTTGTSANVTGTVAIANGGTGATTQQSALNAIAGATTSGSFLRGNGTNVVLSTIQASDIPTLNQNTTGTSANVTGTVALANGGTGLTSGGTGNQVLGMNNAGTGSEYKTITAGNNISVSHGAGTITIDATGLGSGTVTGITAGTGLTGGTINTSGTIGLGTELTGLNALSTTGFVKRTGAGAYSTSSSVALGSEVSGTLPLANGGTGATTAQDAMNTFAGGVTSGSFLRGNGTNVVLSTIQASDIPTLNQNTSGTAANVTGTVAIANGGTGATTQQTAMNALAGATTSGSFLRGNGTNVLMSTIQASDIPTLNQNTTGTAANVTGTVALANGGTGLTSGGTGNQVLGMNNAGTGSEYKTITAGNNISVSHGAGTITIDATGLGSGTVTGITAGAGLTGGTINTSGTIGLGTELAGLNGISTTGFIKRTGAGAYSTSSVALGSEVSGTLPLVNGGTGATTAQDAMNTFAGGVTSGSFLRGNGTNVVMSAIQASDIPTLNQNTTGTAANVSGTVAIANGGTGATTQQTAMNALAGATTSGSFLRGNGTNVIMSTIQASDIPTLNQNSTGTSANVTGTVALANGGTGLTSGGTGNQVLGMNNAGTGSEYKTITAGNNISVSHGAGTITIDATGLGSGTVTGITAGAGLTGGTINTSGTIGLGTELAGLSSLATTGIVKRTGAGAYSTANVALGSEVSGTLPLANGGTGASSAQTAINALAGATTSGSFLRGNGTNVVMSAIQASDIPTLNQNTTGTAANVSGTVAIANGGTGATTQQTAMNALAGATTSGSFLRGNGTNVLMSTIQASDIPTLNQNTTGTAANVTGTVAIANGGTGLTAGGSSNQVLGMNNAGNGSEFKTITAGNNISVSHGAGTITIDATGIGTGTVTGITAGTGLTGGTINSSGTIGLGTELTGLNGLSTTGIVKRTGAGAYSTSSVALGSEVSGTLPLANGGTGATTAQDAMNTFAGGVTSGSFLRGNGTNVVMSAIQASDIPTLNQNTTGTAANVSGTVAIANGGTGATTQQSAMNALAGATTSGSFLRGNGTNVVLSTIQASDIPTLNQNTTGTAANVTGTVAIANGGTGLTAAGSSNQVLGMNNAGNASEYKTITAGTNISVTHGAGTITIDATGMGSGTVTGITAGTGLTGGTINSSGTIGLGTELAGLNGISTTGFIKRTGAGSYSTANVALGSEVSGTLPLANGGTGATTAQTAINALAGATTSGSFLRGNGTNVVMSAIQASDIPTLNQNTTGTAANVTGTVAIANGGTGATTQQSAMNALAGATTSGSFLRGNGTNVLMSTIQASDIPTLNQNTTGTAANVTGTVAIANGGTGSTTAGGALTNLGASPVAGSTSLVTVGTITSGTWNGSAIALTRGGTGLTSGGTSNQVLGMNNAGTASEYKTITAGANISVTHGAGTITIDATGMGSGTVTGITAGTGLTGGTINTSGTIGLGTELAGLNGLSTTGVVKRTGAGAYSTSSVALGSEVSGTLPLANGGTGATSAQSAINALAGGTTSGSFLRGNGTNVVLSTIQASDVPTLNQNTTGTAANVTGTVALANGGTGATSAQSAINALAGGTTSGSFLRGNGTNVVLSTIQASDVPTLNQNTTGTAANVTGTVALANGGTGLTAGGSSNQFLAMNNAGTSSEYKTVTAGTGISLSHGAGTLTINATGGSGTVTGITAGTGLTGGTINTSGTIGLGTELTGLNGLSSTGVMKRSGAGSYTAGTVALGSEISGTLPLANGGTGATSAQSAINALAGGTTSGSFLRGNGTNVVLSTIQASDVPTLNQNTTGTAANVTGTVAIANGGTGSTTAGGALTNLGASPVAGSTSLVTVGTITSGTWNGTAIALTRGGTGLTSGGSSNQVLGMNNAGTAAEYKTLTAGTNISFSHSAGSITINASGGSGTVTGITAGTGLTGGTINTSGTIGLGTELAGLNGLSTTGVVKRTGAGAYSTSSVALGSEVSGTLPLANGGTGATTQQTAMNALAGGTTSGSFLRGNGTNVVLSTIQASDVPTLNQNTTGTAANVTGTVAIANGGTGSTTAGGALTNLGASPVAGSTSLVTVGTITSGTWNGSAITLTRGGTGLTSGGSSNQVLGMNSAGTAAEYKTLTAGTNISFSHGAGSITINASGGSGTVTGITAGTGLTGGTINTSGTIGLGTELTGLNGLSSTGVMKRTGTGAYSTSAVALATEVSGTLPIANGGTGATTAQTAMNALAGGTTSGSFLRGNGTNVVLSTIQASDVPTLNQNTTGTAANVTGTVAIANGGTGSTTAGGALTNLGASPVAGSTSLVTVGTITSGTWNGSAITLTRGGTGLTSGGSSNQVLGMNSAGTAAEYKTLTAGTNISFSHGAGSITINASGGSGTVTGITAGTGLTGGTINTSGTIGLGTELTGLNGLSSTGVMKRTGTGAYSTSAVALATEVSGTLPIANGGTGATTAQTAMNALAGGTTSGSFLRGNGTNVTLATIQASDVPTLNQNTTGTAANVTGTVAVANGGTGSTTAGGALTNLGAAPAAGSSNIVTVGTITSGTWNGTAITLTRGGTGLTSGGSSNQVLGMNSAGTAAEYKTLTAGTNISFSHGAGSITINASGGSGTVTGITAGTGLTGGTINTSGTIGLGTELAGLNLISSTGFMKRTSAGNYSAQSSIAMGSDVSGVLPIANGGTGSSSASGALSALGAAPAAGSTSITTLGTISTGSWNGTAIPLSKIGTSGSVTADNFYSNYRKLDCPGGWACSAYIWDISLSGVYYDTLQQRSDERLKENITSLNDQDVDNLLRLRPVSYHWKNKKVDQNLQFGLIAQEVEKVMPNLIKRADDPEQTYSVNYMNLMAPIIAAIQKLFHWTDEADIKIQNLEEQVANQKEQIRKLEDEGAQLKDLVCLDHPEAAICKNRAPAGQ